MRQPDWTIEGRDWPNRSASRIVAAGGLKWHVQQAGVGPVLLLLHGTGAATHSWAKLLPLLTPQFTVIAPDLPGHGFTAPVTAPSLPKVAGALAELLAVLDVHPAITVGHSAGAAIACRLALDGNAPTAIVSINGALQPFPGIAARLFPAMAQMLFLNPLVPRIFAFQARSSSEVARFMLRSTGSRVDAAGLDFYQRLFACSGHVAGALGMMANWDLESFARDLPKLDLPMLLLAGGNDLAIPAASSRSVAELLPQGTFEALPGLGHLAHEESARVVAERIVSFACAHDIVPREQGRAA